MLSVERLPRFVHVVNLAESFLWETKRRIEISGVHPGGLLARPVKNFTFLPLNVYGHIKNIRTTHQLLFPYDGMS